MNKNHKEFPFTHCGFFLLRTPHLPARELIDFGDNLTSAKQISLKKPNSEVNEAWLEDLTLLRSKLQRFLQRGEVLQSLLTASPTLLHGIEHWKRDADSKKGLQAERSIVRYIQRMCGRATPFGLFSGCTMGHILDGSSATTLVLEPQNSYRSSTRLDFDYLFKLCLYLRDTPGIREELSFVRNSSLQFLGNAWHYVESYLHEGHRRHHLVRLETDRFLERTLHHFTSRPTKIDELISSIVEEGSDVDVTEQDAQEYVHTLIDNEVIVPTILPLVSGQPALDALISQLVKVPAASATCLVLREVRDLMNDLDQGSLGSKPQLYEEIATRLETIGVPVDLTRLFHVDLIKPGYQIQIGDGLLQRLYEALRIVASLGSREESADLQFFREKFVARYDRSWVPLAYVLDPEIGIGYGPLPSTDGSPIIRGLRQSPEPRTSSGKLTEFQTYMLRKVVQCLSDGKAEIELSVDDIPANEDIGKVLPDSFSVLATVAVCPAASSAGKEYEVLLKGGNGPSGARLLGRFCHAIPELESHVRAMLLAEESAQPDSIYAEIVHLPEGRLGNILNRPSLRSHEIPFLGRSEQDTNHQIDLQDLYVTVQNGEIILYSKRLRRRIIPRLTSAHSFFHESLSPVYRFLCQLQQQGGALVPSFDWGALGSLETLPRVRVGPVIVSCARWKLTSEELKSLDVSNRRDCFERMQKIRQVRNMPRWLVLTQQDHQLPVDLDNPLSVDAAVHAVKRDPRVIFQERYPPPDQLCVTGPEGRYENEILIPFMKVGRVDSGSAVSSATSVLARSKLGLKEISLPDRLIPPGDSWQYLKIYGGPSILDYVITNIVPQLVSSLRSEVALERWFYVRYADPSHHLRLRFETSLEVVVPQVSRLLTPLLHSGVIWKLQFDTYEREIERYGGLAGTAASEQIFCADSEAVLSILKGMVDDADMDYRWRAALLGIDALFSDFGLDLIERLSLLDRQRNAFSSEFRLADKGISLISEKYRVQRAILRELFDSGRSGAHMSEVRTAFEARSARIADAVHLLRNLEQADELECPIFDLIASYVHMHVNRMIRSSQRTHEMVIYDFLFRIYDEIRARGSAHPSISVE